MNISLAMIQMQSIPKGAVHLMKCNYSSGWTCYAEGENEGIAFKIQGTGDTPTEAVEDTHRKWLNLTGKMPELIGALPPPDPESYQDAEHMMSQSDDEIPF